MSFKSKFNTLAFTVIFLFLSINILLGYDAAHKKACLPTSADYKDMYFFNKKIYLVSHSKGFSEAATFTNYKFTLGNDGSLTEEGKALFNPKAKNSMGRGLTTAVYKGVIYLFYDVTYIKSENTFKIYYKTSSDPESGWLPADDSGFDTGITADCLGGKACFKAVVFNNLLYLFYWNNNDGIYYKYYDGSKWSKSFSVQTDKCNDMVNSFFFAEPVTIKNKNYICIGLIYKNSPKEMNLLYMNNDNKFTEGPVIRRPTKSLCLG